MYLPDHFSSRSFGHGSPQLAMTLTELRKIIASQIAHNYAPPEKGGPDFKVVPEGEVLDITLGGKSKIIVAEDDARPGEFVLLWSGDFQGPPITKGRPDNGFFVELHKSLDAELQLVKKACSLHMLNSGIPSQAPRRWRRFSRIWE